MSTYEQVYTCADHGDWVLYGANLLVRKPSPDNRRQERGLLPWEHRRAA